MGGSTRNQGNKADYMLGTSEGWDAFGVVRWHAIEEVSQPYRYDITLQRQMSNGAVNLDTLLDAGASFMIASQNNKWRAVHGILASAEEIDRSSQLILYRVVLVPHFWRARYRRRCRNFVGQTLKDIVTSVLENKSQRYPRGHAGLIPLSHEPSPVPDHPNFKSFNDPSGAYRWKVLDEARTTDSKNSPYIVQYNETDFDFLSRLLEQEGLSYYFEHAQFGTVMTITESPGKTPLLADDQTFTLQRGSKTGSAQNQEIVRSFRDARRLQSHVVTMRVYDYNRSLSTFQGISMDQQGEPELNGHYEFPTDEELVADRPGLHAADIRLQRCAVERQLREGASNVRTMEPGHQFTLNDTDSSTGNLELLAVRVETYATELTPQGTVLDEEPFGFAQTVGAPVAGFDSRFLALSKDVPFRPPMVTPKPQINGVQAGRITAEEFSGKDSRPKINADKLARVRVRFPWDQRTDQDDKTPTSDWIRVSQYWAGAAYGALYNPRVGHEVLVAYMQGDPDRPVIVGRVYNPQNPPPYDASKDPTKSTLKSQSAKEKEEVDGFNELRFEDKAKEEQIFLHAERNLDEVVKASHTTSVGGDQTNTVGRHQKNTVHGHREHKVDLYEKVTITGDRTTLFESDESHTVNGDRTTVIHTNEKLTVDAFREKFIGANETNGVTGFRSTTIGQGDTLHVGGWHNVLVGNSETHHVCVDRFVTVDSNYGVKVGANFSSEATGDHAWKSTNALFKASAGFQVQSDTAVFDEKTSFTVTAGSASLTMESGKIVLNNGAGAGIVLVGGAIFIVAPGGMATFVGGAKVSTIAGPVMVKATGDIDATAPTIHLNG